METRAVVERWARTDVPVRSLTVQPAGLVAALEAGRRAARGEAVAFTDDDAVPIEEWLARIAQHLRASPRAGGVGGRDRFDGKEPPTTRKHVGKVRWYGRRIGEHHRGTGAPRSVDVLKGVNMAFRRAAIEAVEFDRRLRGAGSQHHWEISLCLSIKRAGWELLYDPALVVDHYEARRFGANQRGFPDPAQLRNAVHNETYGMLRWLPWWHKLSVVAYGFFVGSRETPGFAAALEQALRSGQWRSVLPRLAAATQGRLDAVGTVVKTLGERS